MKMNLPNDSRCPTILNGQSELNDVWSEHQAFGSPFAKPLFATHFSRLVFIYYFFLYMGDGVWLYAYALCVRIDRMIANMPECMSSSNLDVDFAIKLRMDMVATGKGCSQCNAQMIRFGIRHVPSRRWIMKKISTGNILIIDILIIRTICELLVPSILFLN